MLIGQIRTVLGTCALVVTAACLRSTAEPPGTAPIAGSWAYVAQQSTGNQATLSGTLTLISESTSSYRGALDALETTSLGGQRRLAGPITGRVVNAASVDFTVTFGASQREHVGTLRADTIVGTWFEVGGLSGVSAAGSFRAIRTSR